MSFRSFVVLVGTVVLAAFSLAVPSLVRHGGSPRWLGWTDAPRGDVWVVDRIDPDVPGAVRLRVGDRLVSINGDTLVARYGAGFYRSVIPIGGAYTVGVEREGQALEYVLKVGAGPRELGDSLFFLLLALVWCVVGLFIGYARPDDPVARLAFGVAVLTGGVYLQVASIPGIVPARSTYQPLHMVLGYHFFYRFPAGIRRGRGFRALLWLFYAAGIAFCGIRQSINWVYLAHGPGAATAWVAHHWLLLRNTLVGGNALVGPLALGIVALIVSSYRRAAEADRRRIRWVVWPSTIAILPHVAWAALKVVGGIAEPGLSPGLQSVQRWVNLVAQGGTALIPLGVAYAVVRHRVFDIAVVVRRGLQYLLARRALQVLLAIPMVALVVTAVVNRDRTIGELVTRNLWYFGMMTAAALSLRFRQPLSRWLDRRFFREQLDREQVLVELLRELRRLSEPAEVAPLVRAQVESALHPTAVRLWFDGDPDSPPEPLLARLESAGDEADAPVTTRDILPAGVHVAVPLVSGEERLGGVLLLGEKRSEEPYSATDLSLLGAVARQTAMVHENLLLRERVSRERRIRDDVLAHLEPDRADLVRECPVCGGCYDATVSRCPRDGGELELALPVRRVVAGRYRLDQRIARGGMGTVYEAMDLRLGRTVAIKFLLDRALGREHALRRFRREARALARLHHTNIVAVYDYGAVEPHGAYLVMERIQGGTLREELTRRGALTGTEAADWFAPLLDGIGAAHEEGIVHRDLKPENVVRAWPEHGLPVVKVLDFGLAKVRPADTMSDKLTVRGAVIGTLGYMSPEQLGGGDVDARSDLFAIGVMVAETLTGQPPFRGASNAEVLTAICLEPYHLPGSAPSVVALDAVLQRCLAKDPGDRFPTAARLRQAILPALRECASSAVAVAGPQP